MKHKNIPIFIPHEGCPNDCIFCNQRKISGRTVFDKNNVRNEIEAALSTLHHENNNIQIAFFGGSFTGIDRTLMLYLLGIAKEYIDLGRVSSIRLSTRPDYIDEEILDILAFHGVTTIELGIQSMSDKVLLKCNRGHNADTSRVACRLIKQKGFELIGQMMTALPYSKPEDEIVTAKELVALGVDGARIYPTMVFAQTKLEAMTQSGEYIPPPLDELVRRSAEVFAVFKDNDIPVIRIGLQASDGLGDTDGIKYGAYRAAMGEMVMSRYYLDKINELLKDLPKDKLIGKLLYISCAKGEISKISGQKRENKEKLISEYGFKSINITEQDNIRSYNIKIKISD